MKIAILGGSFNPFHNGHLRIVETVLNSSEVDKVWLLPSSNHPLKANDQQLGFNERIQITRKAVSAIDNCEVHDYDSQKNKPSYTADLLRRLNRRFTQHRFFFIIGYDIIPELSRWYDFQWLTENAEFIIINRPGNYDLKKIVIIKNYRLISMEPAKVSSSMIRKLLQNSSDISEYVPAAIIDDVISAFAKLN